MLAGLAAAVVLVVRPLPVQPEAAEAVLVKAAGSPHPAGFGSTPAVGGWVTVSIGGAHPHSLEAGPGRPDVVVHFPAGPEGVFLVGPADRLDDLAPDHQAEVRQAVQRKQRTGCWAKALTSHRGGPGHI